MAIESGSPLNANQRAELERKAREAHKQLGTGSSVVDVVNLGVTLVKEVGIKAAEVTAQTVFQRNNNK